MIAVGKDAGVEGIRFESKFLRLVSVYICRFEVVMVSFLIIRGEFRIQLW